MRLCQTPGPRALRAVALLAAVSAGAGCTKDRDSPAPVRDRLRSSTLGADLLRAPRGVPLPPAPFGVDLVNFHSRPSDDRPDQPR